MSYVIEYRKVILFLILTSNYILAAWVVTRLKESIKPKRSSQKKMIERLREKRVWVEEILSHEKLETEFKEAGYPFGLNSVRFQMIVYPILMILICWVGVDIYLHFQELSFFQIYFKFNYIIIFYVLISPQLVLKWILKKVKESYIADKNRELFMLYSIIQDEFIASQGQARNLLGILMDIRKYTQKIRPALNKTIRSWPRGTSVAFDLLAKEIGTPEAEELCKILADLDETDPGKIIGLMEARQKTFIISQKENKRRRLKVMGIFGYIGAFVPLLLYLWNMLNLVWMYTERIQDFINNYQ